MPELQNITDIKLLLSIIAVLLGSNIALILFMAKKYIKRADEDHDKLNKMETEHNIYHPKNGNGVG